MLKNILGLVGGLIALNILLVAGLAAWNMRETSRRRREIGELENVAQIHGRDEDKRSNPGHQRLAGVILVTLVFGATTALASPQGRDALTSVLDIVSRGLDGQPAEQEATQGDGGRSLPAGAEEGARLRTSSDTLGEREGTRPEQSPPTVQGAGDAPPGGNSPGGSAPATPRAVTAVAISSRQVKVDWSGVAKETGYRIERSMDGGTDWTWVAWVDENITATVDGDLDPGTTYYYRVFATDPAGDSPASSVASVTTTVDPAAPTTVIAVAISAGEVELNWTDVGNETGYRVERMLANDGTWLTIATTGADITQFVDEGLAAGTAYQYRVFATNPGGDSAASDVVVATTNNDLIIVP